MATKLKRSLFIGLGGTGMKSILKTKQLYREAFGEVPSVIGFLGVDTSTEEFTNFARTTDNQQLTLDASEQVKLTIQGPGDFYKNHSDRFDWVPAKNVSALSGLSANGAGQIRSNGRFTFTINQAQVDGALRNAIDRVMNATNDGGDKWELVDDKLQIYLVFSLSGGTGCGTFLNMAYMIKDIFGDRCVLYGYAVLPNAFQGCGQFVGANAYGAMLDTDYLMSNTDYNNPFLLKEYDEDKTYDEKPFDLFYLVDNANRYGDRYTDRQQLHTMIGQALLAISGSIGSANAQDLDNFRQLMNDGSLDIEDKKSWVSGLGLCEILVNTKKLSTIFAHKAGMKLVSNIIGHDDLNEMDTKATTWINTNNLREHLDDQLLNSLLDMSQMPESFIISKKAAQGEAESETFVKDNLTSAKSKIQEAFDVKFDAVKYAFDEKLSEIVKSGYGLVGAKQFIESINQAFTLYLGEMNTEMEKLRKDQDNLKAEVKKVVEDWKNAGFFDRTDYKSDLATAQADYLTCLVEIARREKAAHFYSQMSEYINSRNLEINEVVNSMSTISKEIHEKSSELQYTSSANPFQIDLAEQFEVLGDDPDNTVSKFMEFMGMANILEFHVKKTDVIVKDILSFTMTLNGANFEGFTLEKMILSMTNDEKQKLFNKAIRKSEILLDVNLSGYNIDARNAMYVSVMGGANGAIANDDVIRQLFKAETGTTDPTYAESPSNKSILIFRQKGVYPIFMIPTITRQMRDYERFTERKSFGFDAYLEEKITDLHYGFSPNQKKEDDVLEMWVKGLIHGFIKKDGQRYLVQSKALSKDDKTNDYWFKLRSPEEGMGTEARFYAFEDFKSKKRDLKRKGDLLERIREEEMRMGKDAIVKLYSEVKAASAEEYVSKYSHANIELKTINTSMSYKKTREVIKDELSYCEDTLLKSLNM